MLPLFSKQDFASVLQKESGNSTFVFVNAEELLEFSRPINHKIVYVGGIAVPDPGPLSTVRICFPQVQGANPSIFDQIIH